MVAGSVLGAVLLLGAEMCYSVLAFFFLNRALNVYGNKLPY